MKNLVAEKSKWVLDLVSAGFCLIPLMPNSKAPYDMDWPHTAYDPMLTAEDLPGNYGVILREDIVVVDVDPRNFKEGEDSLKHLLGVHGIENFGETYHIATGGGGLHIYLTKPADLPLKTKHTLYPGIEIKTLGSQLVGPGSIHPDSRKPYIVAKGSPLTLYPAPASLLALYTRVETGGGGGADVDFDDSPANRQRFIDWLSTARVAQQGDQGDLLTFDTALYGRDYALSMETTLELMLLYWNPRCQPPWSETDLAKKVYNAYAYAKKPVGTKHAAHDFEKVEIREEDLIAKNMLGAKQLVAAIIEFVRRILEAIGVLATGPQIEVAHLSA